MIFKSGWSTSISNAILILIVLVLFYGIIIVNVDAGYGRHACRVGENESFYAVGHILNARSLPDTFNRLLHGSPFFYGRITWYAPVLLGAIPAQLHGETGQIIATRMVQAALLLGAYLLLVFSFVKRPYLRIFAFSAIVLLPYTPYYATVGKPEPVLLLCLAIFLYLASRKGWGKPYAWFPLGLAFGAKVIVLPLVLGMLVIGILHFWQEYKWKIYKLLIPNSLSFLLGVCFASPLLLIDPRKFLGQFSAGMSSGFNDESINAFVWLKFLSTKYFHQGSEWIAAFLCVGLFGVCAMLIYLLRKKRLKDFVRDDLFLMTLGMFSFNLPILLFAKRIIDGGHYWFIGLVLLWIAIFMALERAMDIFLDSPRAKGTISVVFAALLSIILIPQASWAASEYYKRATFTKNERFKALAHDFEKTKVFLDKLHQEKGRKISVNHEANFLFRPLPSPQLKPYFFFTTSLDWDKGRDVVVASTKYSNYEARLKNTPPTMNAYKTLVEGYQMYKKHVAEDGMCLEAPCYEPVDLGLKKSRIWIKVSDAE
jgi:hypothetical protein